MYKLVDTLICGGDRYIIREDYIKRGIMFYKESIFTNEEEYVLDDFKRDKSEMYDETFSEYLKRNGFKFSKNPIYKFIDIEKIKKIAKKYKYYYTEVKNVDGGYVFRCFKSEEVFNINKISTYINHYFLDTPFEFDVNEEYVSVEKITSNIGEHEIGRNRKIYFSIDLYKDEYGKLYLNYVPNNGIYELGVKEIESKELKEKYNIVI